MSDTRNHTTRDQLAAVIAAHSYTYPDSFCACGQWFKNPWEEHAPHLADAILASDAIAAVRAAAVAETTAAIEAALRDDPIFGDLGGAISAAVEGLPASLPESGPPVTVERCYATGFAAPVIAAVSTHLRAAPVWGTHRTRHHARPSLGRRAPRGLAIRARSTQPLPRRHGGRPVTHSNETDVGGATGRKSCASGCAPRYLRPAAFGAYSSRSAVGMPGFSSVQNPCASRRSAQSPQYPSQPSPYSENRSPQSRHFVTSEIVGAA